MLGQNTDKQEEEGKKEVYSMKLAFLGRLGDVEHLGCWSRAPGQKTARCSLFSLLRVRLPYRR